MRKIEIRGALMTHICQLKKYYKYKGLNKKITIALAGTKLAKAGW